MLSPVCAWYRAHRACPSDRPNTAALRAIKSHGLMQACLTNNFTSMERAPDNPRSGVLDVFDVVVESSRVGVRKPEPAFYEMACDGLGIEPAEAVMLDDLGVNLKPAREMGMTTIKVTSGAQAIAELEAATGLKLS